MAEEKTFENKVKKWLKEEGIYFVKIWGGGFQRAGIPDILCCVNGKFVALELKSETGKLSELQKYNLDKIKESGGVALCVRPSDFEDVKLVLNSLR